MFDALSDRLNDVFDRLRRQGALSEDDVATAMREIRVALLEAEDQRLAAVATDGRAYFSGWEEVRELRAEAARLRP